VDLLFYDLATSSREQVGWVERSETHHAALPSKVMGFAALYPSYGYGLANLCGEAVHLSADAHRHGRSRFCEIAQNELLSSGLQARSIFTLRQCLTAVALLADKHGILLT
jgi:hypothetical protein